jgi:hypothetical protein
MKKKKKNICKIDLDYIIIISIMFYLYKCKFTLLKYTNGFEIVHKIFS